VSGPATGPTVDAPRLHRTLGSFEVLLLTLSCLSPVLSIYGLGSDVLTHAGTGAAAMFAIGIAAAAVWAIVYAELASAYPYAGGDYVGVAVVLGPWAGFASLTLWAATSGPSLGFTARTIATYAVELWPAAPPAAVTFAALAAALAIALLAVRTSAWVTGVFLGIELLAVVAVAAAGLWHPARSLSSVMLHPMALGSAGLLEPAGFAALALAGVSAAFATTGGNQAIAFGEELHDPHRRMGNVIVLAALTGAFATAIPVIAVVLGAGDLRAVLGSPAPFSTFFASVAGTTAGHALSLGVAVAVFNALIAALMFYARLFFSLGRDEIFNPATNRMLSRVDPVSGVPRAATLAVAAFAAACCLLDSHTLVVFISGLTVYSLGLVSVAVLAGRRRGLTGQPGHWRSPWFPVGPVLGLMLAAAFGVAEMLDADAGRPSLLLLGGLIAAGLVWHRHVLQRRTGGWSPRIEPVAAPRPGHADAPVAVVSAASVGQAGE
jgi:amino acid transporter